MSSQRDAKNQWKIDVGIAGAAGVGAALIVGIAGYAVGSVSGGEARILVEAMLPTSRFFCSAVMTACATILALMLTLLGLLINVDDKVDTYFYYRIKQIAFYDMLVLISSTGFLVLHCIPITESDEVRSWLYSAAYYSVLVTSSMIAGAMIAIVWMLYAAVRDIIHAFGLDEERGVRENADGK